ncbi:MAG: hypothetical protein ACLGIF_10795, partial [Actinomycetes bacterium]
VGGPACGGVARVEGAGPVTLSQLRRLFGDAAITVRPVLDPTGVAPVDAYEIPDRLLTAQHLLSPADCFPFGVSLSPGMDLDHTIPYAPLAEGGPPEQTGIGRLGFLVRYHHRVRTHGRWRIVQPEPGTYVWRSPTGYVFVVTHQGTFPVGHGPFAVALWHTALRHAHDPAEPEGYDLTA